MARWVSSTGNDYILNQKLRLRKWYIYVFWYIFIQIYLQKHNVASYHLHYLFFILFQYQPILRQFPHLFQWFRASCVISCRILARIETHGQKHWHEMDQDDMYYSYFLFFFFCCCFLFVFVCFISFPLYYFIYLKMWLIPVDTRRCFNVYKTSVRRRRHLIDLW